MNNYVLNTYINSIEKYSVTMVIASIITIVCMWVIFNKASVPGWHAIIPFLNTYDLFKLTWGNGWLFLLLLIPFANFVFIIITYVKLAHVFGKGAGFAVGLIFLNPIFMLILAFGNAKYIGINR